VVERAGKAPLEEKDTNRIKKTSRGLAKGKRVGTVSPRSQQSKKDEIEPRVTGPIGGKSTKRKGEKKCPEGLEGSFSKWSVTSEKIQPMLIQGENQGGKELELL